MDSYDARALKNSKVPKGVNLKTALPSGEGLWPIQDLGVGTFFLYAGHLWVLGDDDPMATSISSGVTLEIGYGEMVEAVDVEISWTKREKPKPKKKKKATKKKAK
jgi:hypothetical protein